MKNVLDMEMFYLCDDDKDLRLYEGECVLCKMSGMLVSLTTNCFWCPHCSKHGNPIAFLQYRDGLSYQDADELYRKLLFEKENKNLIVL